MDKFLNGRNAAGFICRTTANPRGSTGNDGNPAEEKGACWAAKKGGKIKKRPRRSGAANKSRLATEAEALAKRLPDGAAAGAASTKAAEIEATKHEPDLLYVFVLSREDTMNCNHFVTNFQVKYFSSGKRKTTWCMRGEGRIKNAKVRFASGRWARRNKARSAGPNVGGGRKTPALVRGRGKLSKNAGRVRRSG
ncbi:MAG: hypothetical protein AAGU23_01060 [Bacillota bacterium]